VTVEKKLAASSMFNQSIASMAAFVTCFASIFEVPV
jgi:uncharacterized membrane protein